MDYTPNFIKGSHDTDTDMAYDRNQGYEVEFPYPGIYFSQGIVGKVYDEDSSSTSRETSVTCIYQEAASGSSGGLIKSAYSEGNTSGGWGGERGERKKEKKIKGYEKGKW